MIDELIRDHEDLSRKIDVLERQRDDLYAKLKSAFREKFGRFPETADDHFYLRGGPPPRS